MVAGGVGEGDSYGGYRARLVETLQRKGIRDLAVLRAIRMVPRHLFVPESVRHRAYDDAALPIGSGQTISQPYVQARYLELIGLTGQEKVLEIGTGSGYQTALLCTGGQHGLQCGTGVRAGSERPGRSFALPGSATSPSWWATVPSAGGRSPRMTRFWSRPPRRRCRPRWSSSWRQAAAWSFRWAIELPDPDPGRTSGGWGPDQHHR